jgi:hypothetical protein
MNTFRDHLLQKALFETTAQHIIDAYEKTGAIENNLGRSKNYFEEFTDQTVTLSAGGKAPSGHIYIKCKRWVGDWQESDYLLIPMDLMDEVYVERIHDRATAIAQKIVDERNAAEARAAQAAEARRIEREQAQLRELAAKHPNVIFKTT